MKRTREQIEQLFERGTIAEVYPSREAFVERLRTDAPFHLYLGIDPTAKHIHLGHLQQILFLEDMRRLGATVTLLFGSFTGLIGDPTGKEQARKQLTRAQVKENMRTWKAQVSPVLDLSWRSGARIAHNSTWWDTFSLFEFLSLMRETTLQQLLERDMFATRLKEGKPLYSHELIYPILQGYDSVAMKVDAELCGTDQTFNALMGRTFVRRFLDKEKFVITLSLIEADGVLMSKSAGTGVFVDREHGGEHRMFGAIMALPDGFITPLFRGCTRLPVRELEELSAQTGVKKRDSKLRLAREIVGLFWGSAVALTAERSYLAQFSEKQLPENAPVISLSAPTPLLSLLTEYAGYSRSAAKRKLLEGAVSLDDEKITDVSYVVLQGKRTSLTVGRQIFRLK